MKKNRLFSITFGVILISVCAFFLLLFVGIALEFGLFTAWLYAMPLFLGIILGFQITRGKSLIAGVKAWLGCLIITLFPFVAFIVLLPLLYQILSIALITAALVLGLYAYQKNRRARSSTRTTSIAESER